MCGFEIQPLYVVEGRWPCLRARIAPSAVSPGDSIKLYQLREDSPPVLLGSCAVPDIYCNGITVILDFVPPEGNEEQVILRSGVHRVELTSRILGEIRYEFQAAPAGDAASIPVRVKSYEEICAENEELKQALASLQERLEWYQAAGCHIKQPPSANVRKGLSSSASH